MTNDDTDLGTFASRAIEGAVTPGPSAYASPGRQIFPLVSDDLVSLQLKRTALVVALICLVFTITAIVSFPELDDGALVMTINELGAKGIVNAFPDMPVASWIWRFLLDASGVYFWPMTLVLNGVIWLVFALEAAYLWIRVFPDHHGYTPLIGCLAIAPIVIQIQMSMLTISSTGVLSAVAGYLSLFLTLACLERDKLGGLYAFALALLGIAVLFGDYGLSIGMVVFAALLGGTFGDGNRGLQTMRRRTAWVALATTIVVTVLYRVMVHYGPVSGNGAPAKVNLLRRVEGFPLNLFSAAWHVVVGAYGTLLGNFSLTWGSKTVLLSLIFGFLLALFVRGSLIHETMDALSSGSRLKTLFLALIAGLTPIIFNHPFWTQSGFPREAESASRYFIPVMPVAACLTLAIILRFVRSRFRVVVAAVLGLLIGFSLLNQVWAGFRRQRVLASVGAALKAYVVPGAGQVVGVLSSDDLCFADFSCTAKAISGWTPDQAKSFWLFKPNEAVEHLGTRKDCKSVSQLQAGIRAIHRTGAISSTVWVQMAGDKFTLEPYCIGDLAASPAHTASAAAAIPLHPVKGALAGVFATVQGTQDLTQLGSDDWEHWTSSSVPNHKASGGKQIYYYSTVGNLAVHDGTNAPNTFHWSDGTPAESADASTDLVVGGQGHGFQVAAPADTRERTLSVYVGVLKTQGKMQAHLSDGSAADYDDTSLSSTGEPLGGVYRFTYRASSPGQILIVTFTQATPNPQGSVFLEAGTLNSKHNDSE